MKEFYFRGESIFHNRGSKFAFPVIKTDCKCSSVNVLMTNPLHVFKLPYLTAGDPSLHVEEI